MVIFDQINKTILVVAHARTRGTNLHAEYKSACRRVDETCAACKARPMPCGRSTFRCRESRRRMDVELHQPQFEAAVRMQRMRSAQETSSSRALQQLAVQTTVRPSTFTALCVSSTPVPFMFLLNAPVVTLVGSSPEIICTSKTARLQSPLAGTRKRGKTHEEDRRLEGGIAGRPERTGRARDAGRPGPQRCGAGGRSAAYSLPTL